jgi:glyoxalase/bleomycin resistance protein/dioxygenase superfamily protein
MSDAFQGRERLLPVGEPPTGQIAFVVADVEAAAERWVNLGIGPWNIWTFDERRLPNRQYRGRPGSFAMRAALCSIGPLTYELVQSLQGPNIYEDFLLDGGAGVTRPHHLGYYVDDIGRAIEAMERKGYPVAQEGSGFGVDGDGAFAYFDTVADFGCYFEAIVGPRALPEPEGQVPLPSDQT